MPEEKKKSGLNKDISSIFAGLEEIDDGRAKKAALGASPVAEKEGPEKEVPAPPPAPRRVSSEVMVVEGAFPPRRNACVGLDVGASSIKLIQMYPVAGGWEIGGYAVKETRLESDAEGLEKEEYLVRQMKEIVGATQTKNQMFVASIRGGGVNTGLIPLARMPKKEMESACRLEAKRRVAFNVDKALMQSQLVSEESARPGGKLNYMVTIARREAVSRRLSALQEAGLRVGALLPLPFAWKDLFPLLPGADASQVVALVDIGSDRTLVGVYRGKQIQFSREFETGGDQITEAIIQAGQSFGEKVEISWGEAERLKQERNLLQGGSGEAIKNNLSVSHVLSMVRPVAERIVQESKRSLEYFTQLFRGQEISRVYLCGGGALLTGLVAFVQERIHLPVELLRLPPGVSLHPSLKSGGELERLFPRLAKCAALSAAAGM